MMDYISSIRLGAFLAIFTLMLLLEFLLPARHLPSRPNSPKPATRWVGNISILVISVIAARMVLPIGLAGIALYCEQQQWGLFNYIGLPDWASITISLLLLDLVIYWQHRLFHRVPLLWRLHKVHHSDVHVDSTTALRFHPLEIIASMGIKALIIILLGVPASAVILFEILLNSLAIFNHANIRLSPMLERVVRTVLVTQILHRIHHSQIMCESSSNFGSSIVWWDRIFSTYSAKASKSDDDLDIGLIEYPNAKQNAWLSGLLWMPFTKK
ncbi:sterol desaturase family protein [Shewanella baltica]|uniref:sterol desaturase family protein n=1 Tax=Shewanella baltica TaxID=62322 RepID=UPI000E00BEA4|nr:sterol desaturase family protein [Shewanella baltica]SUI59128.1 Fatty acid hydroxylase superfamily [Shewanella baltica]